MLPDDPDQISVFILRSPAFLYALKTRSINEPFWEKTVYHSKLFKNKENLIVI